MPADKTCTVQMWPCACSFDRRRRAAGIGIGLPEDFDERHRLVFRLIGMCMNQWQGCPERSCRRHRGCMAPSGVCINVQTDDPDANEVKIEIAMRHVHLTLRAEKRRHPKLFPA
ncbi:MAG: hypothetical protein Q8M26_01340 [Pseudolabrys sp.]|nr:hypothetical protein [Pseudolabrys sp.]